jgi:hypothetical protein
MAVNHASMIGPKSVPMLPVPRRWIANKQISTIAEIGTMNGCAACVHTSKPSTAEITEIAGVIAPSP